MSKSSKNKIFRGSAFSNMLYGKKQNPGNAGNQQKAFLIKKHPVLTVYGY